MENAQKYLDPAVLAKLQGLDLKARLIVEGYVAGLHNDDPLPPCGGGLGWGVGTA
ncbi:MAG: hypothetical protein HY000_16380 [Planctomycetes bacterium]|nr:hypothetical protein [Planctomycetota bacterium]